MAKSEIRYLVYISRATQPVTDAELQALARISQENNKKVDITGVLIMNGQYFLQVLEGPSDAVNQAYTRILRDPRHKDMVIIHTALHKQRIFGEWFMRAINLDNTNANLDIPGFKKQMLGMIQGDEHARENTLALLSHFNEKLNQTG